MLAPSSPPKAAGIHMSPVDCASTATRRERKTAKLLVVITEGS